MAQPHIASSARTSTKPAHDGSADLPEKAGATGRKIAELGAAATAPVVRSLQQEQPQTIAKIVVAAVLPQLIKGALRYAVRNPLAAGAGILVVSAFIWANQKPETEN